MTRLPAQGGSMSDIIQVKSTDVIERILSLELVRVTERAAVASALLRGRGDEKGADKAAVDAMRRELNKMPIDGTVVIGEGERDEAPMLFIGEKVGTGTGPKVDIAVDPLEGTTLCAKDMPGSIAVMAMASAGSLLNAPDVYMDKIAIGPGYPDGVVDLDASVEDNLHALAKAKGVKANELTALVLDRPRHAGIIEAIRRVGASIRVITDGDVAGVIFTTNTYETGIDIYMGIGGAPEGVLAAAALRCVGGQMQARLILDSEAKRERALKMGVTDPEKKYRMEELASGDVIVAATGVTDGSLLEGVKFRGPIITTETIIYRSLNGTVRRIRGEHRQMSKFNLD
jgi:fructose-1,6-bisphosphatase II / sedoheptulose-1,7-bisphosphatase